MLSHLDKYRIILGSQSPRRKELLKGLDIHFEVVNINVEENYPSNISGAEITTYLANKKSLAFLPNLQKDNLLITADTIVLSNNHVYGKPQTTEEAKAMLKDLSGKKHEVITGVCISTVNHRKLFYDISKVKFISLTNSEIEYYISKHLPLDKAGSYGVQEWIGYAAVEHIEGSYFNIMGLPTHRLYEELKNWNF